MSVMCVDLVIYCNSLTLISS